MAEYIKRADALEAIRKWCGDCGSAIEAVLSVPAARGWDPDGVTNLLRDVVRGAKPGTPFVQEYAENLPAADVAPVRHGRWETNSDRPDTLICSMCKCGFDMWKHDPHNYCPNCGAKMDGDSNES